jgi:ketopantoate reductase
MLIASRVHHTPWNRLPLDARAAQNGLGQPRAVITCFFAIDRHPDGTISATGPAPRVVVGRAEAGWEAVFTAWRSHGLIVDICDDPRPAQWEKTVFNATVGPLCLATGLSMGAIWSDPAWRHLALAATEEGEALGRLNGIACTPGMTARAESFFNQVGSHRPSLLSDPGELPWVLGSLLTAAKRASYTVPALQRIADMVVSRHGLAIAEPR